jgi:hypothetical protein
MRATWCSTVRAAGLERMFETALINLYTSDRGRAAPPPRARRGTGTRPTGNGNRNALLRDPDGNLVELVSGTG